MFFADRHRLTEAVMNLAHNAVQHTDSHDTIAIGTSVVGNEVRIWVRDTGTGSRPRPGGHLRALQARVGRAPSLSGRRARPGDREGRRRGARRAVELDSRLGEGSTFTIVIPARPNEELVVARILIAEDDPLIGAFLEKALRATASRRSSPTTARRRSAWADGRVRPDDPRHGAPEARGLPRPPGAPLARATCSRCSCSPAGATATS